jgi:predicted SAM-dependent methyltransferase
MAPRSAGWNVTVVDHATQADLVEKYRGHPGVDVGRIEAVDVVWTKGPLHEAVPERHHGSYDMLIASHVIEHLPDLIGFLKSASVLLHPSRGILALAVPDKRWCFDVFKSVSTTGQVLAAHRFAAQRHGPATRFDHFAYSVAENDRIGWTREPLGKFSFIHSLEEAHGQFRSWSGDANAPDIDCHAWQFTPASFELLMLELGCLGEIDWRVAWLTPQPAVEFLVHLVPGPEVFSGAGDRDLRRIDLLKRALHEVREQADWLTRTGSMPTPIEPSLDASVTDNPAPDSRTGGPPPDAEMRHQMQEIAETAAMVRSVLRPIRAVWRRSMPIRRAVARLRGRQQHPV